MKSHLRVRLFWGGLNDLVFESLDYKRLELAGGHALETIKVLNMARGDFQESGDESIQDIGLSFGDQFYASIREVFDKTGDGILPSQLSDGVTHSDALDTSA